MRWASTPSHSPPLSRAPPSTSAPIVAVRMGEVWAPQLARQLATLDQLLGGRMVVNIISSELPGEVAAISTSLPPHARTHARAAHPARWFTSLAAAGEFVNCLGCPAARAAPSVGRSPPLYFGGLSARCTRGRRCGRRCVPDVARHHGRRGRQSSTTCAAGPHVTAATLRFGYRVHVVVRETEARRAGRGAAPRRRARPRGG